MKNEFNKLKKVILAEPEFMKITEVINEVQKKHLNTNIDKKTALKEHNSFSETLRKEGVELFFLETCEKLNEQVFTRDIGFVIDNTFFISNLKENIRKKEKEKLLLLLNNLNIPYYEFQNNIEGGDVILHNDIVYVGISNRTSIDAANELQKILPKKNIIKIKIKDDILHLDCVFNILNNDYALIHTDGIDSHYLEKIENAFSFIHITQDEQETMGTNVLSIGENKIISLSSQKRINSELRRIGFHVIEHPFSEIIKSGGSFRCCTLPLERLGV